ncbi:MAG: SH3 domain-containing protein [Treponema sp.]|nr:SH3 domain-containing protein [Treponema sp.]
MLSIFITSCSGIIGYSVVLWNISDRELADGTVVPVYVKSNISHQYIIKEPASGERIEVPLWMLSYPVSKKKAVALAQKYAEFERKYAKCILDGLPIRDEPENGSKQVYRLRRDEVIRVLYRGNGVIPTNGKENLKGEWLRVLASDGTTGWCFSQNLRLFTMNADGSYGEGAQEAQVQQADEVLEAFLKTKWYPDYYSQMISRNRIELEYFSPDYYFDTGSETGNVAIHLNNLNVEYPFAGVTKVTDSVYKFNETPIKVTVRGVSSIIVQYTDASGKPKSYNFVALAEDVDIVKIIEEENERRENVLNDIRALGPSFSSSNYGDLIFDQNNVFLWNNFDLLVPSVISRSAKNDGTVSVTYQLPVNLKAEWDGILTFKFTDMPKEVNLLYKKLNNGIRLSVAKVSVSLDNITERNTVSVTQTNNSLVMFFHN